MAINLFGLSIPQISLPSLPKIEVPKIKIPEPPKIEVPKIKIPEPPKIEIPKIISPVAAGGAVGRAVGGAVAGAVPKVELPKISLPEPPKIEIPKISLPEPPKIEVPKIKIPEPDQPWSGAGDVPKRVYSPEEMAGYAIPTGGVSKPGGVSLEPPPGGNVIDVVIGARDKSYEVGIEQALAGNVAGGGAQFAATAAAEVILPLDLMDMGNLWMTGRGDQIDQELLLWAGIDAVTLAAAPFTLGASYAVGRALKAGKIAGKAGKIVKGGEMGLSKPITKLIGGISRAGQTAGKTIRSFKPVKTAPSGSKAASEITAAMRKQGEAILKQQKAAQKAALKSQKALTRQFTKTQKALTKSLEGLKPVEGAGKSSKLGSTLKTAGITAGGTAIGLTALGVLGAPAPEEVPEGGGGGAGGGADGGYTGGDDWWTEFLNSLYSGTEYDPSLYEGYDPYAGYYDPGYWDPLGMEPYAQDVLTYAEEVPVVGDVATAAKQSGFALPLIVGAVVLVVVGVAFLRSKKGKAMIGGVKKKASKVTKDAKKAVGA